MSDPVITLGDVDLGLDESQEVCPSCGSDDYDVQPAQLVYPAQFRCMCQNCGEVWKREDGNI